MMRATHMLVTLGIILGGAACGGVATSATEGRTVGPVPGRSNLINVEEMRRRGQFGDLYGLILDLRPLWLRSRGPDTFLGLPGQVQVHVNGNRLGGVDALRTLEVFGVASVEWVAPIDASARFGPNYSHGLLIVSTGPIQNGETRR
jgi:hypothetical protein